MNNGVGVLIGRFQVNEVHQGHLNLIEAVVRNHKNVLFLLGCRKSPSSRDNPLNYEMRYQMLHNQILRKLCPNALIMPVFDMETDTAWSKQVDDLVMTAFPQQEAVLYGGRNSFIPHYSGRFRTEALNFGTNDVSGSEIRKLISSQVIDSSEFRAGVIYALNRLPSQVVPCVDIAVYNRTVSQKEGEQVCLLLIKKNEETGWRFPGGHIDLGDPNMKSAAIRELMEETGVSNVYLRAIGSIQIDDWRLRGRDDVKYMTTLFVGESKELSKASAGDDADQAMWINLNNAGNYLMKEHIPLLNMFKTFYNKGIQNYETQSFTINR